MSRHEALGKDVRVVAFHAEPMARFLESYGRLLPREVDVERHTTVFRIVFTSEPKPPDRANVVERELHVFGHPEFVDCLLCIPAFSVT